MDISEEASRTLIWSGGMFSATVSKSLSAMKVQEMQSIESTTKSDKYLDSKVRSAVVRYFYTIFP